LLNNVDKAVDNDPKVTSAAEQGKNLVRLKEAVRIEKKLLYTKILLGKSEAGGKISGNL